MKQIEKRGGAEFREATLVCFISIGWEKEIKIESWQKLGVSKKQRKEKGGAHHYTSVRSSPV